MSYEMRDLTPEEQQAFLEGPVKRLAEEIDRAVLESMSEVKSADYNPTLYYAEGSSSIECSDKTLFSDQGSV